jgi:hypothetical protein
MPILLLTIIRKTNRIKWISLKTKINFQIYFASYFILLFFFTFAQIIIIKTMNIPDNLKYTKEHEWIRTYLERLMALNYDKVTIEWYNIEYISDLEKQPDGRYVGVITIYQRFEGRVGDNLVYVDTTKKDITVYVERKETQIRGRLIGFWDVLLGDIRVSETMP